MEKGPFAYVWKFIDKVTKKLMYWQRDLKSLNRSFPKYLAHEHYSVPKGKWESLGDRIIVDDVYCKVICLRLH